MITPAMGSSRRIFASAVVAMALGSALFGTASAQAAYFHHFSTSFTVPSASPTDVAINQSTGEVYVTSAGSNVVDAFEASGAPDPTHPQLTEANGTTPYPFHYPFGLAVDNSAGSTKGDIYVADYVSGALVQFDPTGTRTAQSPITVSNVPNEGTAQSGGLPAVVNNGGFNPAGVAVAPNGDVYVSDPTNNVIDVFEPNGTFVSQFTSGNLSGSYGIALDSSGDLYVTNTNGSGTVEFGPSGTCVNSCASVDLFGAWGVTTDPEGNVYSDEGGRVTELNSSGEPIQSFGEGTLVFGRGIAFNESTGAIYVADEGDGRVKVFDRFIAPAPVITATAVSNVHSESAQLHAKINPGGGYTTYHFEYGTDTSYGTSEPIPAVNLGSGTAFQSVQLQISGLSPGTTYHWRVVAKNSESPPGGTTGPDHTFTTFPLVSKLSDGCSNALARQQTGASQLLDCRAYEIVSAANTGGYPVESALASEGEVTPFGGYPQAEDPARVLYTVNHGAIPGTNHPTNKGGDPYVATRGESGWSTQYVGVPANDPFAAAPFSSIPSGASAGLEAFAFDDPDGCSPCFEGSYTGVPVRLPSGELVQGMAGSENPGPSAKPEGFIAKDLSANGEHFVFGSKSRFEPDGAAGELSIYDRNLKTDETHVVSKLPGGGNMSGSGVGELDISSDGTHILIGQLVSEENGTKYWHLYMNVGDDVKTIDLTPGATKGVLFDGMTSDGSKVFFSSVEHLTSQDEQHSGADIYMWEEGHPLVLISTGEKEEAGQPGDSSSCDPVANTYRAHWNAAGPSEENCGDVAVGGGGGVASDSGTIYFLSPERLDTSSPLNEPVQNAPNLYVARPGSLPRFIATLESSLTGPLLSRHSALRSFGSLSSPGFITADRSGGPSNGDVYVVEGNADTIYKFDSAGNAVTSWRENGKLPLGGNIIGIATDPSNGDLYVDLNSGEIREFTQSGSLIRNFSTSAAGGGYAQNGIVVDGAGNVYVYIGPPSCCNQHTIQKFSSVGEELGTVASNVSLAGMAFDPISGDLYVNSEGKTIERYSFNGAGQVVSHEVVVAELSGASGVAVDDAHDVYVDLGNEVLEFDASGKEASVPIGVGILHSSTGVAVGPAGEIYAGNPGHSDLTEFGLSEPSPNAKTDSPLVVDSVSEPEARKLDDFQLTASGEFAAFATTLPLTGDESAEHPEVFRYDANEEQLDCVSCNPSGAEATGGASLAPNGSSLTEAGQVFFNSEVPLALSDTDNRADVYEWEPQGIGTCQTESPSFSKASGACLALISTGASPFASSLLGVGINGTDVYFFTRDTLAPQDENGELVKVYDARNDGGFFVTPEPPFCRSSDECHGAGSSSPPPPEFHRNLGEGGNEASARGKRCSAGFVKKGGKCIRKHGHGKKHHKSKHHHGGTK